MKFNKQDLKKRMLQGLSGGLIALMIASNVACDKTASTMGNDDWKEPTMSVGEWLDDQKIGGINVMDIKGYDDKAIPEEWMTTANLWALPLSFLESSGLVENENGTYCFVNCRVRDMAAYADTNSNKINLILHLLRANDAGSTFLTDYHLQYKVSDDEMQTFLSLNKDFRMRFFIQGLDATHDRKIVGEYNLSPKYWQFCATPEGASLFTAGTLYYVDAVDYKNKTITYVYEDPNDLNKLKRCVYGLESAIDGGGYLEFSVMTPKDSGKVIASYDNGDFMPVGINGIQINDQYNASH